MKKILCVLGIACVLLLAACAKKEEVHDNKQKESNLEEKTAVEPEAEDKFEHVYPLTGIGTNEAVDNRIIGVMVNNHSAARPQSGLSQADMVFEILAEGMITRFLAFFQSELPEVVGPVRSAREYYFELANGYDALYIYHGAATFVNNMIKERGIDHLDGANYDNDGNLFKRESFRVAPHNSYLLLDAVYGVAESKGYAITSSVEPLPFLSADEVEAISGEPAKHIEIVYATNPMEIVEFDYDAQLEKYTRFNDREKTVELDSGQAIQVDNVFIVETHHEVIDNEGRRAVDIHSGGNAYLVQKGKIQQLQWENKDGKIIPVKDGKPVGLVPGKTWINVIPTSPGLAQAVTVSNE